MTVFLKKGKDISYVSQSLRDIFQSLIYEKDRCYTSVAALQISLSSCL